jgi:hypothetical protein
MAYTTINKSSEYFNTKLYTGTGATQAITGVGFQPDFLWIKSRGLARSNQINDVVRGAGKIIATDNDSTEFTDTDRITTLDSDGFTLGSNDNVNGSSDNLVSWNWLANGAGVSNTDGDITSTVSANTTSGFSIVKWTGTGSNGTIGHGLGVAPKMVIVKSLANISYWMVYHASLGNAQEIYLNSTSASQASTTWNSTTPTSTVISLNGGAGNGVNYSGDYIAYCFAEKKGYSKFGSYTGNNNADGTFIYTGFKPAWVLFKRSSATENWSLYDNKRLGYNPQSYGLRPNISSAESEYATTASVDFVSNGFKIREAGTNINNGTYIYLAFAEEPLVGTNNIPATAR